MKVALDTAKKRGDAVAAIKKSKDDVIEHGHFTYTDGLLYHCDKEFQEAVKAYLLAYSTGIIPVDAQVEIRRVNNTFLLVNYNELRLFAAALFAHSRAIWLAYWAKKDALPSA